MTETKAIVFDGNGTLFYGLNKPVAIQKTLQKYGIKKSLKETGIAFNTARKITSHLKEKKMLNLSEEAYLFEVSLWLYLLNCYDKRIAKKINDSWHKITEKRLFDDVRKTLSKLSKKYKLVLLTAGSKRSYTPLMRRKKILQYFSLVVGEDTINDAKPKANAYQYVIKKLRLKPNQILMIGDDLENDYYAPKRNKMQAILLDRKNLVKNKNITKITSLIKLKI